MTLNYKELVPTHSSTTLNCRNTQHPCTTLNCPPSRALTINCPPYCLMKQYNSSCDHRPRDDTKNGAYGTMNSGTSSVKKNLSYFHLFLSYPQNKRNKM